MEGYFPLFVIQQINCNPIVSDPCVSVYSTAIESIVLHYNREDNGGTDVFIRFSNSRLFFSAVSFLGPFEIKGQENLLFLSAIHLFEIEITY